MIDSGSDSCSALALAVATTPARTDVEFGAAAAGLRLPADAKLWRIDRTADYGPSNGTARGIVGLDRIRRHWPGSRHTCATTSGYTFTLPDSGGRTYRTLRDPHAADEQ